MSGTYDPLVGHVLDGRYEILAKLARGGMATVYRARDQRLMRTVAVKVMRTDLGEDDEFATKFDREARAAATINHPAVVGVFDQGNSQGQPYIVMEFVEGETLRRLISREAPLPPVDALDLLEPVVSALACAHEYGLVHRDIKPENVLLSHRGQVKVADFGLARLTTSPQMTATGVLVGTASYLPPELVTHSRPDSRSDVYSAGVVLFELLTGQKPHTGENNYQIAYRHVNVDIEPPSQRLRAVGHAIRIPDYVDAFVAACTARDVEARIPDGRVMLERLRQVRGALLKDPRANNPELAAALRPAAQRDGDVTVQISPHPAPRPRPVAAAVGLGARQRVPHSPVSFASAGRPHHSGASPAHRAGGWEARRPRVPDSPDTARVPRPIPAQREDSGRQPRISRTPVFKDIHISQEPVHRRRRSAIALALLLVLTTLAGTGSWWWWSGRYTTAPAVVASSVAVASDAARANDVRLEVTHAFSEEVEEGLVISGDPQAGEQMLRGDVLTVVVSQGPERFAMPDVVGLELATAREQLLQRNLQAGNIAEVWSETVPAGQVLSASHEKDTPLKRDSAVDLTVSKGREPLAIDDFTGAPAEEAAAKLEDRGFTVTVSEEHSPSVPKGSVISQSPASGQGHRGDEVAIVTSLGPVMVTIPDVRYKGQDEATRLLENAGLGVEVSFVTDFPLSLKLAAGTEPAAGKSVPEGTRVTLLVS